MQLDKNTYTVLQIPGISLTNKITPKTSAKNKFQYNRKRLKFNAQSSF